MAEPNVAYIGPGVTIKGEISAPDVIVVDGTIEGDVTPRSIRVGVSGSIKGNVVSDEAEVHGHASREME
jgi:cytoskeletal protein CcmA (bactofilin family)